MNAGDDVLVRVENLVKYFPVRAGGLIRRTVGQVQAVDDVTLTIPRGKTLGLVGETGCGKSTLARCVAGLIPVTSGRVTFDGQDITNWPRRSMRPMRREIQMIFQDPYGSLNPRRRVGSIIGEPFAIHNIASGAERKRRVQELMERVGLNPEHYNRFPAEFSGGQRQRIGVARALALQPKLIICDEPVSALDVSIQAQVLNLLVDLQRDYGLTYLFIAHNLDVVRHVSGSVAVMYLGRICELGPKEPVYGSPRHPYTTALLSAAPAADPDAAASRQRIILVGDVPSPIDPPSGCRFHPRCPKAQPLCSETEPQLEVKAGDAVNVTLPNGVRTTPGVVTSVSSVASAGSGNAGSPPDGSNATQGPGGGSGQDTVQMTVRLTQPAAGAHLDQAPVNVNIVSAQARDVLAVPVSALVALAGGGYAVDVVQGGTVHLVAVQTGLFGQTLVQVSGPGLSAGLRVQVPAS